MLKIELSLYMNCPGRDYFRNQKYKMSVKKYITIKDYADREKITVKTVYNRIEKGIIPKDRIKKVLNIQLIRV